MVIQQPSGQKKLTNSTVSELRFVKLTSPYEAITTGTDKAFGAAIADWCQALEVARIPQVMQTFYQVYRQDEPIAFVVTHTLHKLNLARYFPASLKSFFLRLQQMGLSVFYLTILFAEIPLANRPGIVFTVDLTPEEQDVVESFVVNWLMANCSYDLLCVKKAHGREIDGLATVPFLANMAMDLPFDDFNHYVQQRSTNARYTIRRNKRTFEEAGCYFQWRDTVAPFEAEIMALYDSTCAYHAQRDEMEVPIPIGKSYFDALDQVQTLRKKVLTIWQKETMIGFGVMIESNGAWFFKICGLDYERAPAVRAYFNLYYELIAEALRHGVHYVDFGANTYETKRRIGASPRDTYYSLHFKKWLFKPLLYVLKMTVNNHKKETLAP
ncbi:GNAT family N-acetyltransferase [Spirosoma sp. HMF4905]|uniref:GNAT family N-acetyltransferase n=1 Tax=Spirosoma arboris TaxID=2682092 RepID=A0A7K1SLB5_9BACT|nr:GNAT family N-acetyltransferase [Spirosoma arboris]MVM34599.1 GNAT family N-acetyltransferase [Spirosoma arboris]